MGTWGWWQLEYRAKATSPSLLSYFPLVLLCSQSLPTFLDFPDGVPEKVTPFRFNLVILGLLKDMTT